MFKLIIVASLCMAGTILCAQVKNFLDVPYIETTANVDTLITPDRLFLNISILESDSKDKIPLEKLENKMAAELKTLGINLEEQLKLTSLSSDFKNYFLQRADILKSKSYSLLLYDALTAGKVIQALENIGIANVYFQKAEYSKIDELENEVLVKAILVAKQKGMAMLQPLNQRVGTVLFVSETFTPTVYPMPAYRMHSAQLDDTTASEPIDIDFYQIRVEKQVSVKFKIE